MGSSSTNLEKDPSISLRSQRAGGGGASGGQPSGQEDKECPLAIKIKIENPPVILTRLKKGTLFNIKITGDNVIIYYKLLEIIALPKKLSNKIIFCRKKGFNYEALLHDINPYVIGLRRQ